MDPFSPVFEEDDFWAEQRNLSDPIHNSIDLPIKLFDIIDTPQFQRLRDIKQLGTSQWVYPGAVHVRFSHCIGTAHLAKRWIGQFRFRQPELEITDQVENIVTTAGLVHDLGHGPFSHVFEHWLHERGHTRWNHELMGGRLFEHLIDTQHLDWERNSVRQVQDLVMGQRIPEFPWLSQIIANHNSGIDVDKFDYIERDCHHLGLKSSFQSVRLMEHSRVIGDDIVFLHKEAWNLYELFMSRFSLHRRAYQHRITASIDHMLHDVLSEADSHLHIAEWANDVERYHLLTDSILGQIRASQAPELSKARAVLARIDRRQLYTMTSEFVVGEGNSAQLGKLTAQDIVNCQPSGSKLSADDIILHKTRINFGKGQENPIAFVNFYSKTNITQPFGMSREQVCTLLPSTFQEDIVRVFVRQPELAKSAQRAMSKLLLRHHIEEKSAIRK